MRFVYRHIYRRHAGLAAAALILALATTAWFDGATSDTYAAYQMRLDHSAGAFGLVSFLPSQQFDDSFFDLERSAERFVNRQVARSTALYFTCFGIYILAGLIFLVYWWWMRRDLPVLSVGLLSLLMAAHTAAVSGSLSYIGPDLVSVHGGAMLETVTYLLVNGFVAFVVWSYFPDAFLPLRSSWMHAVNATVAAAAVATSIAFAAGALTLGPEIAAYVLSVSRWITALLMIVVAVLATQAVERREPYWAITSISLALIIVGSIHDVLFAGGGDNARPYLITFAFLGFISLQCYVLIRRSAESTHMAHVNNRHINREVEERTRELRASTVASEAANIAKTEFVTAVTHELRTPLTSMLGYTQLLREELDDHLEPRQVEFFDSLRLSGERLISMVNDLLDLARIEAGRIELKLSDVPLKKVVEEVRSQLFPLARDQDLYIETEYDLENATVRANEARLRHVLMNLVSNAVKFTQKGGVIIKVAGSDVGENARVAISVSDTGPGISPEFMPTLFERFTREDLDTHTGPRGSGLGLTIARELLTRMGGEILVDSRLGEGSTFTVLLPAA